MEFRTKREADPFGWKRLRLTTLADEPGPALLRRSVLSDAWHHWFERRSEAAHTRALLPTLPE